MDLSSPGMGTGLDIKGMVEAMVKADVARSQSRHDKQLEKTNNSISAMGQLKGALSSLQTSLASLSNMSKFYEMKQTLSTPGYFTATVTDQAVPAEYQIQVQALAQAQTLVSGSFVSSSTAVGNGSITINFGTYNNDLSAFTPNADATSVNITISPGSDTLSAICDAINASDSDVKASIVQDATGARLSLISPQTGQDHAMQVVTTIPGLSYDPTTSNTALTQTMAAQNSVALINGITVSESSNQLKNALPGISLNLTQASATQTVTLSIEKNQDLLSGSVRDFVKKYNECASFLDNVTGFNRETKQGGFFQYDSQVKSLKYSMYQLVTGFKATTSNGSSLSLADIGITTYVGKNSFKHGLLEIDEEVFSKAITENYDTIGALFAKTATASTSNMQINSTDISAPAGVYDVVLSEYTPSVSMEGTIGDYTATSPDGMVLNGSGKLSSLSVNVLSGSVGNIGQITITDGLAGLLDNILDAYLDKNGPLTQKNDFLDRELKQLTEEQTKIDERSTVLTKKYTTRWIAVDKLMAELQGQSKMLTQSLDALPKLRLKNN